jgi:hypothetical protein
MDLADTRSPSSAPSRSVLIALVTAIVAIGFFAAIAYHYQVGTVAKRGYPDNTFLFNPDDRFNDFFNPYGVSLTPERYEYLIISYSYFPLAQTMMWGFTFMPSNVALVVFLTIFVGGYFWSCWRELADDHWTKTLRNVSVIGLMSYPFLFTFDRANSEGYIFLLEYLFVHLVRTKHYALSALPLGAAIAMKPFPLVFVVLLLAERRYREIVYVGLVAAGLTAVSMAMMTQFTGDPLSKFGAGWKWYHENMDLGVGGIIYGHSLWGLVRLVIIRHIAPSFPDTSLHDLLSLASKPYMLAMLTSFAGLTALIYFRERTYWKRVALLALAMNLFPYVSADYKLLYVMLPLYMFLNSPERSRWDYTYAVLLALLLAPKNFGHIATPAAIGGSMGIILNPALMMALMTLIVVQSLLNAKEPRRHGDTEEARSGSRVSTDAL